MELICRFLPSFISLFIYFTYFNKDKNWFKMVCYYAINVVLNNLFMMSIMYFIFKREYIEFTVLYSVKYLFLSSIIAILLPLFFKRLPKLEKFIKSAYDKDKNFSLKLFYKNNKIFVFCVISIILNFVFFYAIDLYVRKTAIEISSFNKIDAIGTNLYTFFFVVLYISIIYYSPKILSKIISIFLYAFTIFISLVQFFMLKIKGEAFTIYDIVNTSEGAKYLNFLSKEINIKLIMFIVVLIVLAIVNIVLVIKIKNNTNTKFNFIKAMIVLFVFFIGLKVSTSKLEYTNDDWLNINYPKYYYYNMVNPKKSLTTLGLYEYSAKDFLNMLKNKFTTYGSIKEIKQLIKKNNKKKQNNEYTGMFKDKNLIMIMMESVDYAAINKKSTPTIYKLMNEGWNFTDRYSTLSYGGSTILTEYTSMSGLLHSSTYFDRIMNNNYNYSLPSMFNRNGYKTSSFHENSGKYYNREKLHNLLGFSNSYFLYDMYNKLGYNCGEDIKLDTAYAYCDSQFANNSNLYNLIVNKSNNKEKNESKENHSKKEKFMSFIVTISAHGPYDKANALCEEFDGNQLECLYKLTKRTDDFLRILLEKLKNDDLLKDTVLVLYSDHQAYGYNYPDDYLDSLKEIDENKNIKAIPFIIYTEGIDNKKFDGLYVNDFDIVPTIYNLFGIDYNPNYYIGTDLFDKKRKNMLVFLDETWYENGIYSQNGDADSTSSNYITNSEYAKDILDLNNMIISNNYYSYISKQQGNS